MAQFCDASELLGKLWCFGPDHNGPNVVVDVAKDCQHLDQVKDSVIASFQWASAEGVLANENMRGIRFDLLDSEISEDPSMCGRSEIVPTARRCFYASVLTAQPRLLEPTYLVEIQCHETGLENTYHVVSARRGYIIEEMPSGGSGTLLIKAYLPVSESFGFSSELRLKTNDQTLSQCFIDYWQTVPGDPLDPASKCGKIVQEIRRIKGMKAEMPNAGDFLDKI